MISKIKTYPSYFQSHYTSRQIFYQITNVYIIPFFSSTVPENFDIAEIADFSMTIQWDIKDSEKSLEYELYHRHKTSDTWIVLKIETEKVLRREDGRHMYTLQGLSPETRYELKMCSVDIHQVKSQYTKSLTRKTLTIGMRKIFFTIVLFCRCIIL